MDVLTNAAPTSEQISHSWMIWVVLQVVVLEDHLQDRAAGDAGLVHLPDVTRHVAQVAAEHPPGVGHHVYLLRALETASSASRTLIAVWLLPCGNPITEQTRTPVPLVSSAARGT